MKKTDLAVYILTLACVIYSLIFAILAFCNFFSSKTLMYVMLIIFAFIAIGAMVANIYRYHLIKRKK